MGGTSISILVNVDWHLLADQVTGTYANGQTNFEHVCKITAAGLVDIQRGNEVEIQGMNVVISKVELESSAETMSTIWEGNCSFGTDWQTGFVIGASQFEKAKVGDAIEFIYTTDESATYWQLKTQYPDTGIVLEGNASDLNSYNCAEISSGTASYRIYLTENDVNGLKEKGLYVFGYSLNVTKVNLIQPVSTAISHTIAPVKMKSDVRYNIMGIKNGRGIYVKNGKKYIK